MKVYIPDDILDRLTGTNTWVSSGDYEVVREFDDDRLIIRLDRTSTSNLITLIRKSECSAYLADTLTPEDVTARINGWPTTLEMKK